MANEKILVVEVKFCISKFRSAQCLKSDFIKFIIFLRYKFFLLLHKTIKQIQRR